MKWMKRSYLLTVKSLHCFFSCVIAHRAMQEQHGRLQTLTCWGFVSKWPHYKTNCDRNRKGWHRAPWSVSVRCSNALSPRSHCQWSQQNCFWPGRWCSLLYCHPEWVTLRMTVLPALWSSMNVLNELWPGHWHFSFLWLRGNLMFSPHRWRIKALKHES